jgi:hypothetical protein
VLSWHSLSHLLSAPPRRSAIGSRMMRYEYMILRMRALARSPAIKYALSADHYVIAPDDFFILLSPQIIINFYRSRNTRIYFDLENRVAEMTQFSPL